MARITWIKTDPIPGNASKMCKNTWHVEANSGIEYRVETWQNEIHGVWRWSCGCGKEQCDHGYRVTLLQERWLQAAENAEFGALATMIRDVFRH